MSTVKRAAEGPVNGPVAKVANGVPRTLETNGIDQLGALLESFKIDNEDVESTRVSTLREYLMQSRPVEELAKHYIILVCAPDGTIEQSHGDLARQLSYSQDRVLGAQLQDFAESKYEVNEVKRIFRRTQTHAKSAHQWCLRLRTGKAARFKLFGAVSVYHPTLKKIISVGQLHNATLLYSDVDEVPKPEDCNTAFMSMHSVEGLFLYYSPNVEGILGYSEDDIMHLSGYNFYHPEDLGHIAESHKKAVEGDRPDVCYRFMRTDSSYTWLQTLSDIFYNHATNKPDFILCSTVLVGVDEVEIPNLAAAEARAYKCGPRRSSVSSGSPSSN
eukprot:Clim_evm100s11 gene=Clim_evmTU100s11